MLDLDTYFTNKIAEHDGIKPEEVTRDYLHDQTDILREKRARKFMEEYFLLINNI